MIKNKADLMEYLEEDRKALGKLKQRPSLLGDEIWKYQILLRKCEYFHNTKCQGVKRILKYYHRFRFHNLAVKLNYSIPLNTFNKGLSIAHYGCIAVNGGAQIGKYCRIHEGVTIGATGGSKKAATIGDHVFIGTGAKIIGDIQLEDNIVVGANAVVTKSFLEKGITIAGIPARKISNHDSKSFLQYG